MTGPQQPSDPELLLRVDEEALARFAAITWSVKRDSLQLVNRSANAIYRGIRGEDGVYLRLVHEDGSRGIVNLRAVQEFQLRLGLRSAPVSRPLASRNRELIERFRQGDEVFLIRAEREVPGEVFAPIDVGLDRGDAAFQALGRSVALMHEAAARFRPSTKFEHYSWERELDNIERWLPADDTEGQAELASIKSGLAELEPSGPEFGLTHGDMNCGNIIWDGEGCTIIDFDEPMWNWFAADIVRPMRDYREWSLQDRRRILAAIVDGYRTVRDFSDDWVARLPLFQRFKQMDMYAWTLAGHTMKAGEEGAAASAAYVEECRRNFGKSLEF